MNHSPNGVREAKIDELTPDRKNANKGTQAGLRALDKSLRELGAGRSILVDKNGEIIAGNKTTERAADLGIDDVIIVQTDGTKLVAVQRTDLDLDTDQEARQLAYADNRIAELDLEWDYEQVDFDLEQGVDLEWLGFEMEQEPPDDPGAQIDRAEELREKWGVEKGQLWRLGEHRLICGDCTDAEVIDRLMMGKKANLHLTDPPYGISIVKTDTATVGGGKEITIGAIRGRRKDTFGGKKNMRGTDGSANWVDATPYRPVEGDDKPFEPEHLIGSADNLILFGANYYSSKLPDSRCWIVWDKNNTGNFADAELAWTSFDKGVRLFEFTWNGLVREGARDIEGVNRMHPTQKPVGLFEMILSEYSENEEIVIDWYLGSGTTLIACERLGRKCRAVEISPAYCAVAIDRWYQMTGIEPILLDGSVGADDKERKE